MNCPQCGSYTQQKVSKAGKPYTKCGRHGCKWWSGMDEPRAQAAPYPPHQPQANFGYAPAITSLPQQPQAQEPDWEPDNEQKGKLLDVIANLLESNSTMMNTLSLFIKKNNEIEERVSLLESLNEKSKLQ